MGGIVFVLGAGASVADVATSSLRTRPPLDAGFFQVSSRLDGADARLVIIRDYFRTIYGIEICGTEHDSVESVMSSLYPDMFNSILEQPAQRTFRALLSLFTERLARTTNAIRPTQKRLLYRMLSRELRSGRDPADITIVTFNQDLQVEKTLALLSQAKHWAALCDQIFCFPGMYGVAPTTWRRITVPSGARDVFAASPGRTDCLRLLKLHGSLNWYSTHTSSTPTPSAMLNPKRQLSVTRRRIIDPSMTLSGKRKQYALPVVVPPVNHKSSVLPNALNPMWTMAEKRLSDAEQVVVFGYSCPALDFESANLLRRAHRRRAGRAEIAVIDPNGAVLTRYVSLLELNQLGYFASGAAFLDS